MDIMTKLELARKKESERFAKIREHAVGQGLVIVRVGARTYQVVTLSNSTPCARSVLEEVGVTPPSGWFVTFLEGEVVFKGNWVECKIFVEKHAERLPPDLCPQ